jgi:hypothetical protein
MILFDLKADLDGAPSNGAEDSKPSKPRLSVRAVFEQVEPLQPQLARIASFHEPIQRLCDLANVLGPLREFELQVRDLSKVLEPMHNFQDRIRQMLKQCAPLEALDQELKQFCAAFGEGLSELAASLGPAVTLQDRLTRLAAEFEPAKLLREEFSTLAQSFAPSSSLRA